MKRKLLAILLTMAMVITMIPAIFVTVTAEVAFVPQADAWFTENGYTAITDAAGLKAMAANGKYYLKNDIDFAGQAPIGSASKITLDGNGHKIYNVSYDLPMSAEGAWPKAGAVFNRVYGATIKNVTVVGALTSAADHGNLPEIGGLIGTADGTVVLNNVVVDVDITVTNEPAAIVGGIIGNLANNNNGGYNTTHVTMINCVNKGDVTSSGSDIGGLVGVVTRTLIVENCVNEGTIKTTGADANVGGLAGRISPYTRADAADAGVTLSFTGFENKGTVDGNKTSSTKGQDGLCVGGLVGILIDGANNTYENKRIVKSHTYTNCVNSGTVLDGVYTGGLIGRNSETYAPITFTNCANNGIVDDMDSAGGGGHWARSGGLIGNNDWTTAGVTFTNCQNNGPVLGNNDSGGFVGQNLSGLLVFDNCVNNAELTGKNQMGGFIGYCNSSANSITMRNCMNLGDIISAKRSAGFIARTLGTPVLLIEDSVNFGTIKTVDNVNQSNGVGGFISSVEGSGTSITLNRCVNFGDVVVRAKGWFRVGGIIACTPDSNSTYVYSLTDCANYGTLNVAYLNEDYTTGSNETLNEHTPNTVMVGGIVGKIGATTITLTRCYDAGKAIVTATNAANFMATSSTFDSMIGTAQGGSTVTVTDCASAALLNADGNKITASKYAGCTLVQNVAGLEAAATTLGNAFVLDDGQIEPVYALNKVATQVYATQEAKDGAAGTVDVRVLALVNSLGYDKAGVNIYKVGNDTPVKTATTTTVYSGVINGEDTLYAPYGTYYLPITVKGINAEGTYTFVVETFVEKGEDVTPSDTYTIVVTDGEVVSAKKN